MKIISARRTLTGNGTAFLNLVAACALPLALIACDTADGPMEKAGERVDNAYEESKDNMQDALNNMGDEAQLLKEDAKNALDKAGDTAAELASEAEDEVEKAARAR
jgi:hypothetical protein